MPIAFLFFLLSFHSNVMERDINLSPSPNGWLEQKRQRKPYSSSTWSHPNPVALGDAAPMYIKRQPWPRKTKRERSGGKMICFITEQASAREVSYVLETLAASHLLAHKLNGPLLWKSWRQKPPVLLNCFFYLFVYKADQEKPWPYGKGIEMGV